MKHQLITYCTDKKKSDIKHVMAVDDCPHKKDFFLGINVYAHWTCALGLARWEAENSHRGDGNIEIDEDNDDPDQIEIDEEEDDDDDDDNNKQKGVSKGGCRSPIHAGKFGKEPSRKWHHFNQCHKNNNLVNKLVKQAQEAELLKLAESERRRVRNFEYGDSFVMHLPQEYLVSQDREHTDIHSSKLVSDGSDDDDGDFVIATPPKKKESRKKLVNTAINLNASEEDYMDNSINNYGLMEHNEIDTLAALHSPARQSIISSQIGSNVTSIVKKIN